MSRLETDDVCARDRTTPRRLTVPRPGLRESGWPSSKNDAINPIPPSGEDASSARSGSLSGQGLS